MILLSLAPLVIVGLVAVLLLHDSFFFLGGIAIVAVIVVALAQHQKSVSRRLYTTSPDDWMSKVAFYVGPFDDSGLPGAASFERQHSRAGNPPRVRLVVTNGGLSFGPAGHSGSSEMVPYGWMGALDLIEGTHPRKVLITPPVAALRGQVVVTTAEGKIARFSGIPVEGIRAALRARGARIEGVVS